MQPQQLLCQQGSQCLLPVSQGETSARVGKFPANFRPGGGVLSWLQRLGATPDADLRNCCPRAGGQGAGLCHCLFQEEARRLESQLASSCASRTAILGVST